MPTLKKRINISLPKQVEIAIVKLAKRDTIPTATKALELINLALEIEEDDFLNNLADQRTTKNKKKKHYTHDEAWK